MHAAKPRITGTMSNNPGGEFMGQPMQPVITIAVSDALARIEAKIDAISNQMASKADMAMVHEMESRLRVVETTMASQSAVGTAMSRGRSSIWLALASLAAAASAIAYVLLNVKIH